MTATHMPSALFRCKHQQWKNPKNVGKRVCKAFVISHVNTCRKHICPPCLNTWDKLHKEHYCLKRSSDRDSNPKYTKGAIFLLTVVPFIHLDCFGLSCWVLKMPAVEMSAFSRVKWNETSLGVWDARSAKNVKVWTYSSSRGSCSWLASLVSLHLSMSRGILPSAYWYGKKVGEHDEPSAI